MLLNFSTDMVGVYKECSSWQAAIHFTFYCLESLKWEISSQRNNECGEG